MMTKRQDIIETRVRQMLIDSGAFDVQTTVAPFTDSSSETIRVLCNSEVLPADDAQTIDANYIGLKCSPPITTRVNPPIYQVELQASITLPAESGTTDGRMNELQEWIQELFAFLVFKPSLLNQTGDDFRCVIIEQSAGEDQTDTEAGYRRAVNTISIRFIEQ